MLDEETEPEFETSGEEAPASDSYRSPDRQLTEDANPVEDAARSARATNTASDADQQDTSSAGDVDRAVRSEEWNPTQMARDIQQTPAPGTPEASAPAPADTDTSAAPRPRVRQIGQIAPIAPIIPMEQPQIMHSPQGDSQAEAIAQQQGQREGAQMVALDYQQQRETQSQQIAAQRAQVAQINSGDPYQGDDGRWKKQQVDPLTGAVNEHDVIDSGWTKLDRKTGNIVMQTANGPQVIGQDGPTVDLINLANKHATLTAQGSAQQAAIATTRNNLAQTNTAIKAFGGVPENLEAQVAKYASIVGAGDPDDPNTQKSQVKLAAAQAQMKVFTDAHPEYNGLKAQRDSQTQQIREQTAAYEQTKSKTSQALQDSAYVKQFGTLPPDTDLSGSTPTDVTTGALHARAGEIAASTGLPIGAATGAALIEAKNARAATVGGVPIDQQLKNYNVAAFVPQMNPDQLRAAVAAGVLSKSDAQAAIAAKSGMVKQADGSWAPDPNANNDVGPVQDFVSRLGAANASALNRAGEGVSRMISGDSGVTQWFKGNADNALQLGPTNPARANSVEAGVARGLGSFISTIPVATATALALPEALGAGAIGIIAKGSGMAASMLPIAFQFGTQAFTEAYDREMVLSGNKAKAITLGTAAAGQTLKALPAYMVAGVAGGAIAGKLIPELASPLRAAATHFFVNGTANSVASASLRALNGEPIIPTTEGVAQDWAFASQHAISEHGAQAQKNAFVGTAQDIAAGTDPVLKANQAIAANAPTGSKLQADATKAVANMQAQAKDFLAKVKAPTIAPGSKNDDLASSISDLNSQAQVLRTKIDSDHADKLPTFANDLAAHTQALSDTEDKLHSASNEMMARVPADVQARIAKLAAPDVDWDAAKAKAASSSTAHFAMQELGDGMRDDYLPPEKQRAIRTMARGAGVDPEIADHVANQALGAKATNDLRTVLTGGQIERGKAETLKAMGFLQGDPANPAAPLRVTEDAQHLFPPGIQKAVALKTDQLRYAPQAVDAHGQVLYKTAVNGMQRFAESAKRKLPQEMPGAATPAPAAKPEIMMPAPAQPAAPDTRPLKLFAAEVRSHTLSDAGVPAQKRIDRLEVKGRDAAEAEAAARTQHAADNPDRVISTVRIQPKKFHVEQSVEQNEEEPILPGVPHPSILARNNERAAAFRAEHPEVSAQVAKQVGIWVNKFRSVFKDGIQIDTGSDNSGGAQTRGDGGKVSISWNDMANSAEATYRMAVRGGESEDAARAQVATKIASILDEELRHAADVRANSDTDTKSLWDSLPPEIQDATKRVYSRDNPGSEIAGMTGVQFGREYKRILSQNEKTGQVSELAEVTKEAATKAMQEGRSGWVAALMGHIKRMADWLSGNKGGETARQLNALHDELQGILDSVESKDEPILAGIARPLSGGEQSGVVSGGPGESEPDWSTAEPGEKAIAGTELERQETAGAQPAPAPEDVSRSGEPAGGAEPAQPRDVPTNDEERGKTDTERTSGKRLTAKQEAAQEGERVDAEEGAYEDHMRGAGALPLREAVEKLGGLPSKSHELRGSYGEELNRVQDAAEGFHARNPKGEGFYPTRLFSTSAPSADETATRLGFQTHNDLFHALEEEFNSGKSHWVNPDAPRLHDYGQDTGLRASRAKYSGTGDLFGPQALDDAALKDAPDRAKNFAKVWSKLTAKMSKGEKLTPGEETAYRAAEGELGQKYLFDEAPKAQTKADTARAEIARRQAESLRGGDIESQNDLFTGKPEAEKSGQGNLFASKAEDDEKNPALGGTPSERLTREAEQAGVTLKTDELKGLIRSDPAVMAAIRAKIKVRTGKDALYASRAMSDEKYKAISEDVRENLSKTKPEEPTEEGRADIRAAYESESKRLETPNPPIADVMEKAGFEGPTMELGKRWLAYLYRTGEVTQLSTGDWSLSDDRQRAWGIRPMDAAAHESPMLRMKMVPASILPGMEHPETTASRDDRNIDRIRESAPSTTDAEKARDEITANLAERPRKLMESRIEGQTPEEAGARLNMEPATAKAASDNVAKGVVARMKAKGFSDEDAQGALFASRARELGDPLVALAKRTAAEGLDEKPKAIYDALMKEHLTAPEIADKLKIPVAEVRKHLADAADILEKAGADTIKAIMPKIESVEAAPMYNLNERVQTLKETIGKGVKQAKALQIGAREGFAFGKEQHDFIDRQTAEVAKNLTDIAHELPVSERAPFLQRIAKLAAEPVALRSDGKNEQRLNAMYRDGYKIAASIKDRGEELRSEKTITDIQNTAKRVADNTSVDPLYRRAIARAIRNLDFARPSAKTVRRMESTKDFMATKDASLEPHSVPQQVQADLERLGKFTARDLPPHVLDYVLGAMQLLEKLGRLKVASREAIRAARTRVAKEELAGAPTTPMNQRTIFKPQPGEKASLSDKVGNGVARAQNAASVMDKALLPMDSVFDQMGAGKGSYDGWLEKHISGPRDLANGNAMYDARMLKQGMQDAERDGKLAAQDSTRIGLALKLREGTPEDQAAMERRLKAQGVSDRVIADVKSKGLTAGQQKWVDEWDKSQAYVYPRIARVAREEFAQDVPKVDKYFPSQRDWEVFRPDATPAETETGKVPEVDQRAIMDQLARDMNPRLQTHAEAGMTKERVKGAMTPINLDAFKVAGRHVNDATYFYHMTPVLGDIGRLVKSPEVRKAYGDAGQKILIDHLDTLARRGGVDASRKIAWLDWLRRKSSAGAVAFRLASQLKHTSNIPFAFYHVGPGWWGKGFAAATDPKAADWIGKNMPEIRERAGGEMAQAELPQSWGTHWGFWGARNVDRLNAQASALGAYARQMAQKGVSPEQMFDHPVDKEAIAHSLILMRRSVASPFPKDTPQIMSRGTALGNKSVADSIFQFGNFLLERWSNVRGDLYRSGIQEGDRSKAVAMAATLAAATLLETGIVSGIKSGTNLATGAKDTDKHGFGSHLLTDALRVFPFLGNIMQVAIHHTSGIPVIDTDAAPFRDIGDASKAKPGNRAKPLVKAAFDTAAALGVPGASQIGELAEKKMAKYL